MTRTARSVAAGVLATLALTLAACGEDGPSTLSADDLVEGAERICRTATRGFDDLDPEDPEEYLEESVELLSTASDALEALRPGDRERGDYEDFTASVSDQVRQVRRIAAAVEDGDDARVATELADLEELTAEGDEVAEDLDLSRCVGLGQAAVAALATGAPPTTTPTDTTVDTVDTVDTVEDTTVDTVESTTAPTLPATTVPVITTAPPTVPSTAPATVPSTAPPATDPEVDDLADGNLLDGGWDAPDGYTFGRETGDIFVLIFPSPKTDPVIAPLFTRYEVGALDGPRGSMVMMVLEITEDFTDVPIDAYISFEGNDVGTTVTSPAGWKMWVSPAQTDETFDSTMVFFGRYAITLRTDPGVDALPILDSFIANNFE